ncbi:MAG: PaaI family thioesterase [Syntrophales bacterium]|nr:PaaI family thioesterase [Syntrophales bacterium]
MKTLNPDHIKEVLDLINQGPYFRLLSMKVRNIGKGFAKVEMDIENKHLNPFGGVHGGVYSSLIDTATYWAVYCDVEEDAGLISLDIKVDNLASVKEGHVVVEGKRIKAGKSICIAEAVILDGKGKYLAHGTSKQMVIPGLQTIAQAVSVMGYKRLPPKFISKITLDRKH